jgi:hypothetical protein
MDPGMEERHDCEVRATDPYKIYGHGVIDSSILRCGGVVLDVGGAG